MPFLETVDTNMLVANMDCAHEPTMEGKYNKSMIIERSGRKIGVIGVILETTYVSLGDSTIQMPYELNGYYCAAGSGQYR